MLISANFHIKFLKQRSVLSHPELLTKVSQTIHLKVSTKLHMLWQQVKRNWRLFLKTLQKVEKASSAMFHTLKAT